MTFLMGKQQRANLLITIILKGLVVLGTLTGLVACSTATPASIPSRQPNGAAVAVLEGTLIVTNSASEEEAKAGEKIYVSTGSRFRSGSGAAVTLRLPDQCLLHLASSTASQVEDWSPAGNIVLRGLSGTLTLEALSDKTTLKMSFVTAFGLNSLDVTAVPALDGAVISMVNGSRTSVLKATCASSSGKLLHQPRATAKNHLTDRLADLLLFSLSPHVAPIE